MGAIALNSQTCLVEQKLFDFHIYIYILIKFVSRERSANYELKILKRCFQIYKMNITQTGPERTEGKDNFNRKPFPKK